MIIFSCYCDKCQIMYVAIKITFNGNKYMY